MKRLTAGHVFYHEDGLCLSDWFARCTADHNLLAQAEFLVAEKLRLRYAEKKLREEHDKLAMSVAEELAKLRVRLIALEDSHATPLTPDFSSGPAPFAMDELF